MTAATMPFADKFFKVRDTLTTIMRPTDLLPLTFIKIAREGKHYQIDHVDYIYRNDSTIGTTTITRPLKKFRNQLPLTVQGSAFDMLSIFYHVRQLNLGKMQPGDIFHTPIFSGDDIELLDIVYQGIENVSINKVEHKAYYIKFRFYTSDGKKTSDNISAWLDVNDLIPLQLEGKLPIGAMKVILTSRK